MEILKLPVGYRIGATTTAGLVGYSALEAMAGDTLEVFGKS